MPKPLKTALLITILGFFYSGVFSQSGNPAPALPQKTNTKPLLSLHARQNNFLFVKQIQNTPKPFFCRMEDRLYNRFNILITLRAGGDEWYRRMIAPAPGDIRH